MRFLDLKTQLQNFPLFSLSDIRTFDPDFDRRRLSEWQAKNYLQMIIRGFYRFTDTPLNDLTLFFIANKIYQPSYISLEMALAYYHLIPESVYTITSISSAKTTTFTTPVGTFAYQSVRPELLFGITLLPYQDKHLAISAIEKGILDYFYLHPELNTSEKIAGLRLNSDELIRQVSWPKLDQYLQIFQNQAMTRRIHHLKQAVLYA